jgi:hypothetical protein
VFQNRDGRRIQYIEEAMQLYKLEGKQKEKARQKIYFRWCWHILKESPELKGWLWLCL